MESGDIDCLNGMTEEALKELRGYQNLLEFWCDGVLISVIGQFLLSNNLLKRYYFWLIGWLIFVLQQLGRDIGHVSSNLLSAFNS